jgi:hypothetical protein
MPTTTATANAPGYVVTVQLTARAMSLESDAQRAADAVAAWLGPQEFRPGELAAIRGIYAAAMQGKTEDLEPEDTTYGRLLGRAAEIAQRAAADGWANPWAEILATVDVEPWP